MGRYLSWSVISAALAVSRDITRAGGRVKPAASRPIRGTRRGRRMLGFDRLCQTGYAAIARR